MRLSERRVGVFSVVTLSAALLSVSAASGATPEAAKCNHRVGTGGYGAMEYTHTTCAIARRVGNSLEGVKLPARVHGFTCRQYNVNAGGGKTVCKRGKARVTVYWE